MGRLLLSSRNPTGYQGVYAPKARAGTAKPFVAMLTASGVQRHIGWFRTAVEAAACYTRVRHALDARSQKASRAARRPARREPASWLRGGAFWPARRCGAERRAAAPNGG